jgi:hypothetical protein
MSYLNSVQKIINRIGDDEITKITVNHTPLSKVLKFLLNITSQGQLENKMENTDYDTLYHLFMVIQTKNGSYVIEKNEVIQIYKLSKIGKGTVTLPVPVNAGLTLNDMLSKTKSKMGGSYFTYMGSSNNCQNYILSILTSNGINTDPLEKFVLQDTTQLFEGNPQFRKIVNTTTDVGAVATTALDKIQGKELLRKPSTGYTLFSTSNMNFNNILNRSIPEFFRSSGFSQFF